jgi:hypothetical protein
MISVEATTGCLFEENGASVQGFSIGPSRISRAIVQYIVPNKHLAWDTGVSEVFSGYIAARYIQHALV